MSAGLGVRLTRSEARIKVVNNKEVMVMGDTNKLKIDIGGNKVKMAFTIIEGMVVDCILGMDYLDKTKVVLFPSERKLRFPGDLEVYLDRRKSKEDAQETKNEPPGFFFRFAASISKLFKQMLNRLESSLVAALLVLCR